MRSIFSSDLQDLANQTIKQNGIKVISEAEAQTYPSCNTLPVGTVAFINVRFGIADTPNDNFIGTIITYARNNTTIAGIVQLAVQTASISSGFKWHGKLYIRTSTSGVWSGWKEFMTTDDVENKSITRYAQMIISNDRLEALTGNNEKSADDFPPNKIIVLGANNISGKNLASINGNKVGCYLTLSYLNNKNDGYTQLFINRNGIAYRWKVAGSWTPWSCNYAEPDIYYVGSNREHTSLISLLIDIKNKLSNRKTIIYIDTGTYDIYNEYTQEIQAGRITVPTDDIESGDYFYPYNAFVPTDTTIIGIGKVILQFTPTVEQLESLSQDTDKTGYGASRTWSPLNIYGEVTIENITVIGKNCRYCLHNDDHGAYANTKQTYRNCVFKYYLSDTNSAGKLLGFNNTIGFGINDGSIHTFEDCEIIFEGDGNHPAYYGHNGSSSGQNCKLILKNCIIRSTDFSNNRVIRLQTLSHGNNSYVRAQFENCYINGGINLAMYYTDSVNAFDVTLLNSNKVPVLRTIASGGIISDPYTMKWLNPLQQPTSSNPLIEIDNIN